MRATQHPEDFSKVASVQKKVGSHVNTTGEWGPLQVRARLGVTLAPTSLLQVDEVKGIMTENIEKVLARGERLALLVDKTEDLLANVSCRAWPHGHTSSASLRTHAAPRGSATSLTLQMQYLGSFRMRRVACFLAGRPLPQGQ